MKERPILMSAPMVNATLRELVPKSQTRRTCKLQPWEENGYWHLSHKSGIIGVYHTLEACTNAMVANFCPYGKIGDHLWVRETHYRFTGCAFDGKPWEGFLESPNGDPYKSICYADSPILKAAKGAAAVVCVPSIFTPRWASRITLEITEVRVQRLQDISEEDVVAEGCELVETNCTGECGAPNACRIRIGRYVELWEKINGAGSWERNDWVWVISFRKVCEHS